MSRALYAHVAAVALLVLGLCGDGASEEPGVAGEPTAVVTAEPDATPPPGTTAVPSAPGPARPTPVPPQPPESQPFPDDLRAQAEELLLQIGAVRGTEVRGEVDMRILTREQARAYYLGDADAPTAETPTDATPGATPEPTERRFDLKQETYILLGMVPAPEDDPQGRDLEEQQIDNLIDLITGFYSDDFQSLYIVESINGGIYGGLAVSTIVHELTHALQYQYRDIDRLLAERDNNWDATTALLDVIEGDAVHTENLVLGYSTRSTYRQPTCFQIPAPQRAGTPYVVERELDTWYEDGLCFIAAVQKELTRGITGVFEDLPTTTEQILHPEKYLAGEVARPVTPVLLTSRLGAGWLMLGTNTFGEFGLQNILLTALANDRERVQAAAAGWGGDALFFYRNGDGSELLQVETRWDSRFDAGEFFDTLAFAMSLLSGELPAPEGAESYRVTVGSNTWSAAVSSDRVTLLVSNDLAALITAANVVE